MEAKQSAPSAPLTSSNGMEKEKASIISNERVAGLITTHCVSCHSRTPTDDIFKVAPMGVVLDSWEDIERFAPQVVRRTTVTKDMPFLNKTKMTEEERQVISRWFAQKSQ
ncbi:hypothetical protein [Pseudoalteromonas lipolytica]|uniref:Cytochrome c domain-containing protein n=1 Tax=Pseudoalteromonas lipolytica TaxID=570156 RepID=A0ABY1GUZ6_9GAMM|nr:hypothetical protein [Pseudoalteromonas lipolytica]MBE0349277.1 hypothetical protein [Pseudoalteromonas lipolytica LMEB 39]SFU03395.1 hypothetical protein SAMN04487854_1401 [Pseudoalteromonas lipolytica]